MKKNENIFTYCEEQVSIDKKIVQQEQTTQTQLEAEDILKVKIKAPEEFIKLETQKRNYMCSTQGWKEPICERYGFSANGKWVQLDIPHNLMEKLELKKETEISYPIHINKEVLEKELSFGGITLEKEDEIFIEKPLTEKNLEKELKRWLSEREKLEQDNKEKQQTIIELEKSLEEERIDKRKIQEELDELRKILNKLTNEKEIQTDLTVEQISRMEKELDEKKKKIVELDESRNELVNQIVQKETEINQLKEKVKDLKPNKDEETIFNFIQNDWFSKKSYSKFIKEYFETGTTA